MCPELPEESLLVFCFVAENVSLNLLPSIHSHFIVTGSVYLARDLKPILYTYFL